MGSGDLAELVRIEDPAGRPCGTGFLADHQGTVLTGHEVVEGRTALLLRTPDGRSHRVGPAHLTLLPDSGLALVRTEGLTARPLPLAARQGIEPGTYVRIAAHGWREARVLGGTAGPALELAIGTEGAEALDAGGPAAGGPVLDPATGAVLAVLGTALHGDRRAAGHALPLPPAGPLAALLLRNAATVPAYGRDLNLAGVLELTATTTCTREELPAGRVRDDGEALVLAVVGAPGTGRSTALAGLATRRARGPAPAPTVWLRGADLRADDRSVAEAIGRALHRAGRVAAASGAPGDPASATPEQAAALARAAHRPLLVLLDGPEEMPPLLAHRLPSWTAATEQWLAAHGARLVVACRPEHWEQAAPLYVTEPRTVILGELTEAAARDARRRHAVPDDGIAEEDARHPLALRLLGEVRAATRGEAAGRPRRDEVFAAHLALMCLRVAVRIAAGTRPVVRGTAVRRLAARVSGQVHEAARRCLGPGQGELDRESFEELFPWPTGWASAVLTEALLVPAGAGYRFAHEELADWLQGAHLDVDRALDTLVRHPAPPPGLPVPRHRVGPVLQALHHLHRDQGPDALATRLAALADALADFADATGTGRPDGAAEGVWWASRLLGGVLGQIRDLRPYLPVLRRLADHIGARPGAQDAFPGFGAPFWAGLRLAEGERVDLLRRLVPADPAPGAGAPPRFLDAVAGLLAADPRGVQPLLCRWFGDERPLAAAPGATVGTAAQAVLHTHRGLAVDDLCEALVATAHPLAEGLLGALAEDEPTALCRAVDRWAHDDGRPERRTAAAAYGRLVAPHVTSAADRATLRFAALALLARPADRALHGPALGLLVRDPDSRARHLPRALVEPGVPVDALGAALASHPEPVLDALRARLHGHEPAAVLRLLARVPTPRLARRAADLVAEYAERHPEGAALVAAFVDTRLEEGPVARCVLHPLVVRLLAGAQPAVRAALAPVLAAPGTGASRFLRAELREVLHGVPHDGPPAVTKVTSPMPMPTWPHAHGSLRPAPTGVHADLGTGGRGAVTVQRWRGLEDIPQDWGRSVVTIGSYDGVHRGHQLIIGRAVERARELGLPSVVVTFDPHPSEVVRPGSHPPLLAPHHRRAELMAELGVDAVLILPFTSEFSQLSPADFIVKVLVDKLHAKRVIEGPNFRFGHRAAGNVDFLAELGATYDYDVEVIDLRVTGAAGGGQPFSSTLTRRLVAEGDMVGAAEILGRPHRVEGIVVRGAQRGRELGFPTANVETLPHTAIPADGVYAGWLTAAGERMPAAISVGTNPQFDGTERTVEAYAIDREGLDLYGLHVAVDFLTYVRGMLKFDTLDDLLTAMADDVKRSRELTTAYDGA